MDLSKFSDAELEAIAGQKSDLSHYSDAELEAIASTIPKNHEPSSRKLATQQKLEWEDYQPKKGARSIEGSPEHMEENLSNAKIARDIPIALTASAVDLPLLPYHVSNFARGKPVEFMAEKVAKGIDRLSDNTFKPQNAKERIASATRQSFIGVPGFGLLGKALQTGSKVIPNLSKAAKFATDAGKLNKTNIGAALGAGIAGQSATELFPDSNVLPIVASLGGGAATAALVNGALRRTLLPKSLPRHEQVALKMAKDLKHSDKWNKRLDIDLDKLKRDQALGIEGTLGQYSKKDFITTHELAQRRHPSAEKFYKKVDQQNIDRYKELLGMNGHQFNNLDETVGGELLQKAAEARKAHKTSQFDKEYKALAKSVPVDTIIPEEMVKNKAGKHIFRELEKLTPSEQIARLSESDTTPYLERLANTSKDLSYGKSSSPLHDLMNVSKENKDLLKELSPKEQSKFLEMIGHKKAPERKANSPLKELQDSIGALQYHSAQSIKSSLGDRVRNAFGLLTDKRKNANKQLWAQLEGIDSSFLKKEFPTLYAKKMELNKRYATFKREEVPIINNLLGSTSKPITDVEAFKKAINSAYQKPEYITHAHEYLTPEGQKKLNVSALRSKSRKTIEGDVTATSYAKGFKSLPDRLKSIYLSHLNPSQKKMFLSSVDSILSKKALEHLQNTSGTAHYTEHHGLVKRGVNAVSELRDLNIKPLIHFLSGDLILPGLQAKKVFTNQEFLKNLSKLSHSKETDSILKYANKLVNNSSFKEAINAASRSTVQSFPTRKTIQSFPNGR